MSNGNGPVFVTMGRHFAGQGTYPAKEPLSESAMRVVGASNDFAFRLYSQLKGTSGNVFFSPLSLVTAWAMVREGARGKTASEIDQVLGLPAVDAERRQAFAVLCNSMSGAASKPYELMMANALWAKFPALQEFNRIISEVYRGEVGALDVARINAWVRQHTNDKIPEIVSPDMIDDLTRFILTNAVYFRGTWVYTFPVKDTTVETFNLEQGRTIKIRMMHLKGAFSYIEPRESALPGLQILELPYNGNELSMLLLLPRTGGLAELEGAVSTQNLFEWCSRLNPMFLKNGSVSLPRFNVEASYELIAALKSIGLSAPFVFSKDFAGMDSGAEHLRVGNVLHRAFVEVNEQGTEAAAATAIVMPTLGARPKPFTFDANHPFMFAIRDTQSGAILFLGRVSNPSSA
ncbi:MAG: serpin family protein [Candidatus Micrarchaeota archaeon]